MEKGSWRQELEVDDFRCPAKNTHFLEQGFSVFRDGLLHSLYKSLLLRLLATPLPPNSPHPEDLGEEYLSLQCWKMTSLLKCMNFYLQRTSCFHPKEVLCKGPGQGLQCMSLSNILPTAPTSSSWPVISCLLHLSESCNFSKTLGRNWLPLWMGQWLLQLIGI